jgi:hypothetical protein
MPLRTQSARLATNPLPTIAAQSITPSPLMTPLLLANSGVERDRKEVPNPVYLPQTSRPELENGFPKVQAIAGSSLIPTSQTYVSPFAENQSNQTVSTPQQQAVDLEVMAAKVERRLLRRLVVESERRGQNRWGLRS